MIKVLRPYSSQAKSKKYCTRFNNLPTNKTRGGGCFDFNVSPLLIIAYLSNLKMNLSRGKRAFLSGNRYFQFIYILALLVGIYKYFT